MGERVTSILSPAFLCPSGFVSVLSVQLIYNPLVPLFNTFADRVDREPAPNATTLVALAGLSVFCQWR